MRFHHEKAKRIAQRSGMSQAEIARAMKVSQGTVSNLLNGAKSPQFDTVAAFAAVMEVELGELVEEEEHAAA